MSAAQAIPAGEGSGTRRLWLLETAVLVLVGVVLAVATVNDLGRAVDINHRVDSDLSTWRHYTHHDYINISVDEKTLGEGSQRDLLCGNTSPGAPGSKTQICLTVTGPVVRGLRTVYGGWYLPPYHRDELVYRYGCFGSGGRGRCPR